jgi:hypothetical protein
MGRRDQAAEPLGGFLMRASGMKRSAKPDAAASRSNVHIFAG